jgi:hypothetical protein
MTAKTDRELIEKEIQASQKGETSRRTELMLDSGLGSHWVVWDFQPGYRRVFLLAHGWRDKARTPAWDAILRRLSTRFYRIAGDELIDDTFAGPVFHPCTPHPPKLESCL